MRWICLRVRVLVDSISFYKKFLGLVKDGVYVMFDHFFQNDVLSKC